MNNKRKMKKKKKKESLYPGLVAQAYNPSYLGGGDQEDHSSRPSNG
jgi:hypothetical protein